MQPDLLIDPPFQRHSATSLAAAEAIQPKLNSLQWHVLHQIKLTKLYGATDEEVCGTTGLSGNTVRPRRIELLRKGLIRDSGRTRATASGRQAVVWVAVI